MGDMKDKIDDKMNDMENKAHEMKGRIDQKMKDNKEDQNTDDTTLGNA